jgi:hypothetical protein
VFRDAELGQSTSESEKKSGNSLSEEERKEDVELVSGFFLIILGIIVGYFASVAAGSPNALGISILFKAVIKEVTHFPILPTLRQADKLTRATGFLVLIPLTVIIYPLMLTRYRRWLRKQVRFSLVRELTAVFFLLLWPVAASWIINPPSFLDPTTQMIQRLTGVLYVIINWSYFLYKTRSVRRGFFY